MHIKEDIFQNRQRGILTCQKIYAVLLKLAKSDFASRQNYLIVARPAKHCETLLVTLSLIDVCCPREMKSGARPRYECMRPLAHFSRLQQDLNKPLIKNWPLICSCCCEIPMVNNPMRGLLFMSITCNLL